MREYFPKPKLFGENMKVEVDVSKYATKADLKKQPVLLHQNFQKRLI